MITEDYVSFEVAKLLKEKGFEEETWGYYPIKGDGIGLFRRSGVEYNHNHSQVQISAPTLQMAMKWLREEHNIHINLFVTTDYSEDADGNIVEEWNFWSFSIGYLPTGKVVYDESENICGTEYQTYEEAAEAAIKYCLTNLIK